MKSLCGYFIVSMVTLPFINTVWLGEVPLLALIQVPKITLAGWLRKQVVMEAIKLLGLSSGSFSPDYIMARPYGLGLAYMVPICVVAASIPWQSKLARRHWRLAFIFLATAVADYFLTLVVADSRSLTIY